MMKFICALITVNDMVRSCHFYETLLGQEVKYDFGENITFHGDFAIHLRAHFQELIDNKEIKDKANDCELYFECDDLEQLEKNLNKEGVEFVHNIREQPWRQKVMRFYDPDNHIIEVGESLEHLSHRLHREGMEVEKISRITHMTREFVKDAIARYEQFGQTT
jgi:catechol 2,3-dioxygenase-like lactoylglutathione lyase family enzyme